ncbi:MAG: 3-methyl-2-oxobutanoate hydroxymethyltransferase, partial [Gammaproteobacteria bacterium]|nr:3-methyl-2-oxobutanoate hydroxymethyltransferase [Gammaproteobacteria bacterium]
YHSAVVSRVVRRALLVVDMPFMSYTTPARALGNAARLVSEGGAEVVKLEGGDIILDAVRHLTGHGIAVCGHLGLTPQSINQLGGYRAQGRQKQEADTMINDARNLQEAGASMLVLECVPASLAAEITRNLDIPVIGIGAGNQCDGQVLVVQDMLGLSGRAPRFSRNFLEETGSVQQAVASYVSAVKDGSFPGPEHLVSE